MRRLFALVCAVLVIGAAAVGLGTEPVFGGAAVLAAGLAAWALLTPAARAGPQGGLAALLVAARDNSTLRAGFALFTLPALFSGVLEVLVPLRMDDLGASGIAVGAAFLVAAAVEAAVSPLAGRASDRLGRMAPLRAGLMGATAAGLVLALPGDALVLAALLALTVVALGMFWAPAMALLTDAAEEAGVGSAMAIAVANLAWATGHVVGGAGGSGLADLTADAVPYAAMSALCVIALLSARVRSGSAPARAEQPRPRRA